MSDIKIKFYRVQSLPEQGEIGSLYFVYSEVNPKLYVCTADGFEQYSDLFTRDFSTLSVDAVANAGDGVVYFTSDTHQIIKDGMLYGGGDITAENVEVVPDSDITVKAVTFIKDESASTETSFIIQPNYKYLFGEKSTLTITLGEITNYDIVNHYMFEFTSGSTATTLSLPASIKWTTDPSIKPNKIYQISIENNLGVIQEWT